jgi:hypothetical protein
VDRHPLDAIARAGTSEELPGMRATEAIDEYDPVAFRDNVEHLASRVGDRLKEHLVQLSPSTGSDLGAVRREGCDSAPAELGMKHIFKQVKPAAIESLDQS